MMRKQFPKTPYKWKTNEKKEEIFAVVKQKKKGGASWQDNELFQEETIEDTIKEKKSKGNGNESLHFIVVGII